MGARLFESQRTSVQSARDLPSKIVRGSRTKDQTKLMPTTSIYRSCRVVRLLQSEPLNQTGVGNKDLLQQTKRPDRSVSHVSWVPVLAEYTNTKIYQAAVLFAPVHRSVRLMTEKHTALKASAKAGTEEREKEAWTSHISGGRWRSCLAREAVKSPCGMGLLGRLYNGNNQYQHIQYHYNDRQYRFYQN